jgi:hypothetical protein
VEKRGRQPLPAAPPIRVFKDSETSLNLRLIDKEFLLLLLHMPHLAQYSSSLDVVEFISRMSDTEGFAKPWLAVSLPISRPDFFPEIHSSKDKLEDVSSSTAHFPKSSPNTKKSAPALPPLSLSHPLT